MQVEKNKNDISLFRTSTPRRGRPKKKTIKDQGFNIDGSFAVMDVKKNKKNGKKRVVIKMESSQKTRKVHDNGTTSKPFVYRQMAKICK